LRKHMPCKFFRDISYQRHCQNDFRIVNAVLLSDLDIGERWDSASVWCRAASAVFLDLKLQDVFQFMSLQHAVVMPANTFSGIIRQKNALFQSCEPNFTGIRIPIWQALELCFNRTLSNWQRPQFEIRSARGPSKGSYRSISHWSVSRMRPDAMFIGRKAFSTRFNFSYHNKIEAHSQIQ
jgi:hypothetical protein